MITQVIFHSQLYIACKQCLRQCHKSKTPYVCVHDSVVVPLPVIKTLSKNLEVIRALRERHAMETAKIEKMKKNEYMDPGAHEISKSGDEKINKLKRGSQYIDVSVRDDSNVNLVCLLSLDKSSTE